MKSIQTDINPTEICYQTHETYTIAHTIDFITFFFFFFWSFKDNFEGK